MGFGMLKYVDPCGKYFTTGINSLATESVPHGKLLTCCYIDPVNIKYLPTDARDGRLHLIGAKIESLFFTESD